MLPLYFAPVSLIAWHRGRSGALVVAALGALAWMVSNFLAGQRFSHPGFWIANTLVQGASFATVGLLIASLRRTLRREQELSRTDPLTGVSNSRAFYEEAHRLLSLCRRKGHPITVAYLDLDNFKNVNDQRGHQVGDDLLRSVAGILRAGLRPSDLVARLGGDEFAVLMPEAGERDAATTLDRLRSSVMDTLGKLSCPVTTSIGAITFIAPLEDVEAMVQRADSAMYAAKTGGKNRVHHVVVGALG